jgi:hypothetical protein
MPMRNDDGDSDESFVTRHRQRLREMKLELVNLAGEDDRKALGRAIRELEEALRIIYRPCRTGFSRL